MTKPATQPRSSQGEADSRPATLPALTGLRTVGALAVALFHFRPTLYAAIPATAHADRVLSHGDLGVPLFFILSGFVIWHNYGTGALLHPRGVFRFVWRRGARLWPVNVLSTVLAIPVVAWGIEIHNYWGAPIPGWYSFGGFLASAMMVSSLLHPDVTFAWNQPAWSLSGEMVAYAVFPVVVALALSVRAHRLRPTVVWLLPAVFLAYQVIANTTAFPYRWLANLVVFFLIGVLTRWIGLPTGRSRYVAWVLQFAAPAGVLACFFGLDFRLVVVFMAASVWAYSAQDGPLAVLLSTRASLIAGQSSYSLYMLHWIGFGVAHIVAEYIPALQGRLAAPWVIGQFLAVLVASWATWRFYETPARQWMNTLFDRWWPRVVPEPIEPSAEGSESTEESLPTR